MGKRFNGNNAQLKKDKLKIHELKDKIIKFEDL